MKRRDFLVGCTGTTLSGIIPAGCCARESAPRRITASSRKEEKREIHE